MDGYVLEVQKWVNKTFKGKPGYTEIEENGKTGWNTIYALLHGLQITLNVGSTANNFGTGTVNAFNKYVEENGPIQEQEDGDTEKKNIYGIIQGALLCKGYSIGANGPTCNFFGGTANAVKELKADAGLDDNTSVVTLNIMKALMSMDYFYSYDTSKRTQNIIKIQRYLNRNYENYIGIRPCDGVYGSRTNKALIYAIQAEENMPISTANGNFGPSTKRCCPTIPYQYCTEKKYDGSSYTQSNIEKFAKIANMSLYLNGYDLDFEINTLDINVLNKFQKDYSIPIIEKCDITSWMSLLVSSGNPDRSAIACDCATIITESNIDVLTHNGFKYIARYVSGTIGGGISKALSTDELQLLFKKGIRVFPIYQGSGNYVDYFNESNAVSDANKAVEAANNLYLEFGSIIYFAVDCDVMDYQVTSNVIPYFKKLYSTFMNACKGKYRVGIYGTRNTCTRVCDLGYACSSFVSDMSTGYSGNLGFPIPNNWALDQFATITIYNSDKSQSIEIDKDGFSNKYLGISQEYSYQDTLKDSNSTLKNSFVLVNRAGSSIPVYESKESQEPFEFNPNHYVVSGKKIGEIKPNDAYVFFGVEDPFHDSIHKVLFSNGVDFCEGFITGIISYDGPGVTINSANFENKPQYQEAFSCIKYIPDTGAYNNIPPENDRQFVINKPVAYYDYEGNYEGILEKGDILIIPGGTGIVSQKNIPWSVYVRNITKENGETLLDKFVSVGLNYGNGKERAWY